MRLLGVLAVVSCGRLGFDPAAPQSQADCPVGYEFIETSCYRTMGGDFEWIAAEQICEVDGAHLVIIDDEAEADRMQAFSPDANHWIGTTDRRTEGIYLDLVGRPAAYQVWQPGEPDPSDAKDCVLIDGRLMFMDSCESVDDPMCEYDGLEPRPGVAF